MIIREKYHHVTYNQKQLFKYHLNRSKGIAIGNTIFNLPCIYDLIHPILAKNYIRLL